ncbi:hypothetical protein ASF74_14855 [Arthrobacter sp. Leaf145]|nr:hypothetical protein ASF74_14855 [Arthrobacter sp. Leaf145]
MLDTSHRCDRCGSQAYVLAVLDLTPEKQKAGTPDELYFCAHHYRDVEMSLAPQCGLIVDETDRLLQHVTDDKHVS